MYECVRISALLYYDYFNSNNMIKIPLLIIDFQQYGKTPIDLLGVNAGRTKIDINSDEAKPVRKSIEVRLSVNREVEVHVTGMRRYFSKQQSFVSSEIEEKKVKSNLSIHISHFLVPEIIYNPDYQRQSKTK